MERIRVHEFVYNLRESQVCLQAVQKSRERGDIGKYRRQGRRDGTKSLLQVRWTWEGWVGGGPRGRDLPETRQRDISTSET